MYIDGLKDNYESIDQFLQENKTKLASPEYFFGVDNGQDTPEMFNTAKYRVLICFLSPGVVRGVSNTFIALSGIVKAEMGDDVFIDYAYTPDPDDQQVLIDNKIPFWFGNVSHHPVKDYDLILVSHSIVPESFNFSRDLYYSGIPLSRELRFKDKEVPFILYGGAASIVSSNILGEIPEEYGGGHSLVDACNYGFGEDRLNHVVRFLLESGIGKKEDKEKILDAGTHKFPYLADPLAYEFITDEEHPLRIKEIKKLKDWLPDKVAIGNTYDTEFPGFSHKVFNLDGQNADSADVMLSLGCSGQGACAFKVTGDTLIWTPDGLKPVKDYSGTKVIGRKESWEESRGVVSQGSGRVFKYTTANGFVLKADLLHRFMIVKNDKLVEVQGKDLKPGDVILRRLGSSGGRASIPSDLADLLGFMHGDGCLVGATSSGVSRWKIYLKPGELEYYEPIFRKYVQTDYKTRVHYTCKDGTPVYVIEGNALKFSFDIQDVSCDAMRVPQVVFEGDLNIRTSYLRGIFQADGWFNEDLGLTSICEDYIHDVAHLLVSCGIDCSIHKNDYFTRHPNGRHKPSYYILVNKAFQQKFIDEIGFVTKSHTVSTVGNRTKAHLYNSVECMNLFREEFPTRDACGELDCFYRLPSICISDYKIRKIEERFWRKLPEDSVLRMVASGHYVSDVIASVEDLGYTEEMYDVVSTESSLCVYGDFLTHNCSEGTVSGPFREKQFESIKKDLWNTKQLAAPNSCGFYAYNLNYYSHIFELLSTAGTMFSSISLINMRVDEIANNSDFLTLAKALGQIRSSCAIGSSRVLTSEGYKFIKDVKEGDYVVSLGGLKKVVKSWCNGRRQTYKVVTHNGRVLQLTGDHKLLTGYHYNRPYKDCDVDHILGKSLVVNKYECFGSYDGMSVDDAEFLGWLVGDGYYSDSCVRVYLGPNDVELKDKMVDYMESHGASVHLDLEGGVTRLTSNTPEFVKYINGFNLGSSHDGKCVPAMLWQAKKDIVAAFLRGYFSADGSVDQRKDRNPGIRVASKEWTLMRDVQLLLSMFGIESHIKERRNCGKFSYVTVSGESRSYESSTITELHLKSSYGIAKYASEIGFLLDYKRSKACYGIQVNDTDYLDTSVGFDKVESVEESTVEEVYDITVADTPYFVMEGIISHNCAIEGMGERVRNHILNKNLSKETLYTAARAVFEQKFIMAKFGMIRTGWETREDQQEFLDEIDQLLTIRDSLGANTALQFSFTPLVVYDNIPLRYEPRVTARESLDDEKNMGWFLDELQKIKMKHPTKDGGPAFVRCKFNGRGPGTFIEQMLLDGGRAFTKVLVRMSLDDGMDYQRNFSDPHKNSLIKWCDYYKIDYRDIFRERDNDEIFWSDWIQFVTKKRLQEWHDQHIAHDYSHGYCLKTNSSKGQCYGCGTCPTPDDIKKITKRDLTHMPVEDAIAMLAGSRVRSVTRVIFDKKSEWRIYSNRTLAHYITSRMLQKNPELVDKYHAVSGFSTFWLSQFDQKDWYSGYAAFDIEWKDLVSAKELSELIDSINAELHIGKIKVIHDIDVTQELSTKATQSYVIPIDDIALGRLAERFNNFDWNVKVMKKDAAGMVAATKVYMPELRDHILMVPAGRRVLVYMNLPITVSPILVLSSILGTTDVACRKYEYRVVDIGMPSDLVCKNDGMATEYGVIANKQLLECPMCRGKKILYLMTR